MDLRSIPKEAHFIRIRTSGTVLFVPISGQKEPSLMSLTNLEVLVWMIKINLKDLKSIL